MPRIVCLSDTHNCTHEIEVPDGDILIHAGDATIRGTVDEVAAFNRWFKRLPHPHKIFVAGNHDWLFELDNEQARSLLDPTIIYLQDSSVEIDGVSIYGSPWQPRFFDWAFNLDRGSQMAEKWAMIPDEIDILITHGPPHGILDRTPNGDYAGCEELNKRIEQVRPAVHVFGHIHLGYGTLQRDGTRFVNACICDEEYAPSNAPIVVDM